MGVDVARGLAVVGMVGAHVGVTETFDWARIETWTDLVHGRSSILFAIVAGVSVALLTGGHRGVDGRDVRALRLRLVGRGAAVFAIGIALELLGTGIAVILPLYGVLFVAVIPFLQWRRRTLLLTAVGVAAVGPPLLGLLRDLAPNAFGGGVELVLFGGYPITVWMSLLLAGMAIGRSRLDKKRTAAILLAAGAAFSAVGYGVGAIAAPAVQEEVYGSWSSLPGDPASSLVCESTSDGSSCYPAGSPPLSSAPDIGSGSIELGSSGVEAGSGSGVESTSGDDDSWTSVGGTESYLDTVMASEPFPGVLIAALDVTPHSGGVPEVFGSGGLAVAILGACLLIARPLRWVLLPVAAVGAMPLTAYSAHVVVILFAAGTAGTSMDNTLWIWLTVGLLAGATLWTHVVGRGPLERLTARSAASFAAVPARPAP